MSGALDHLMQALRERTPRSEPEDPAMVWASVALILAPDPLSLLLIRRAERGDDPWSGHVALPGGRRDPGDRDLIDTAIRETQEEVGLALERQALLGRLDDLAPRTPTLPPIVVRPHVFLVDSPLPPSRSAEVADAVWEPLAPLLSPDTRTEFAVDIAGTHRRFPAYRTAAGTLWGMTERILASFRPLVFPSQIVK